MPNNIFECEQCSKYVISCVCNAINNIPTKAISRGCKNFECPALKYIAIVAELLSKI